MLIKEFAQVTEVSPKTIRYYEEIDILPPAARKENGYREYSQEDVVRLKLVAGARKLDISLAEIKEILDMRDRSEAPCLTLLSLLDKKQAEIHQRIVELQQMEIELEKLAALGRKFPTDDVAGKNCICHLVSEGKE